MAGNNSGILERVPREEVPPLSRFMVAGPEGVRYFYLDLPQIPWGNLGMVSTTPWVHDVFDVNGPELNDGEQIGEPEWVAVVSFGASIASIQRRFKLMMNKEGKICIYYQPGKSRGMIYLLE